MHEQGYTIIAADSIFSDSVEFSHKKYLLLQNGIIKTASDTRPLHHTVQYLDFAGRCIAPLFCDYHLHFFEKAVNLPEEIAGTLLQCGIGKVLEGGSRDLSGLKMKQLLRGKVMVKTAGYAVYKKGAYGRFIGKGVVGPDEARGCIDDLSEKKADYFKLINSGIFDPVTGRITPGGFCRDELREIVQYAKERGLPVFCHSNGSRQVLDAVAADVSCVIHGLHASDETLAMMAEKDIAFIPTLNAFAGLSRAAPDREAQKNVERAVEGHLETVRRAVDRGVRVLAGSDSGPSSLPYGKAYHGELDLFRKAGLSVEEILRSSVAEHFRRGMHADYLVLNGLEIERVCIQGNPHTAELECEGGTG